MPQPRPIILHPSDIPARERGGGVTTIPLVTRHTGATRFINGFTLFAPGAAVQLHYHNCDESVLLLEGAAVAEIDGAEYAVRPGDVSFIPTGIHHRFRNASGTEAMKIMWTYASIDADRTIVATGENRKIDDEHEAASAGRAVSTTEVPKSADA